MPLSPGDKLGPYEILAPIGAGGMGEVYRAKDTKLEREVAIKVLPAALAHDPERLTRFEREAKVLASLNHPNIAQIYGIEELSSSRALVMELVPGQTLQTPLPQSQALRIAVQIAEALEAAHEKGIIHRDLKPANIMITPAGVVKVLDFGLAAVPQRPADGEASNSPTLTMQATQAGMIMGTAGYMSPEQAAGEPVDKRADIWSFGVVLWEMLVGQRMFTGSTVAHILADVLRAPVDLDKLPKETPRAVRNLLKRCLDRDVKTRLRDVGEARIAIQTLGREPEPVNAAATGRLSGGWAWRAVTAAATIVAALAAWGWWRQPAPEPVAPVRFSLDAPPDTEFRSLYFSSAISPDGRLLVFAAQKKGSATMPTLWLREMNSFTSRELPGTENGYGTFWSPDSKSIGFQADGKLKRIDLAGSVQTLFDLGERGFEGGSWNQEGVILFGLSTGGIQRISAAGGAPVPVTTLNREGSTGALSHRYPHFLPDGHNFLYTQVGNLDKSGIYLASLDNPNQAIKVVQSDAKAVYAPPRNGLPGYLFWVRDQTLVAQRFDPRSKVLEGDPLLVADGIAAGFAANARRAAYSVSTTGMLTYRGGGNAGFELAFLNRDGKREPTVGSASFQRGGDPAISPDGRRVVMERQTGTTMQVWLYETSRGITTRLTLDPGFSWFPVWSPDGRQVAYSANRNGSWGIYRQDASGAGQEELLLGGSKYGAVPSSWSPDGRHLLYETGDNQAYGGAENQDILLLPLAGSPQERTPVPYLQTPFRERNAKFSPDGRWVAYQSAESGRDEVYIQAFPSTGAKWQVSNNGGMQPRWRGDGRELFFINETTQRIWVAGIRASAGRVEIETPQPLFSLLLFPGPAYVYDVTPDGQRFVVVSPPGAGAQDSSINVISDWQAGLKK
jgi:serine/threonine protein kinase/Tol biopolymer transport system component